MKDSELSKAAFKNYSWSFSASQDFSCLYLILLKVLPCNDCFQIPRLPRQEVYNNRKKLFEHLMISKHLNCRIIFLPVKYFYVLGWGGYWWEERERFTFRKSRLNRRILPRKMKPHSLLGSGFCKVWAIF